MMRALSTRGHETDTFGMSMYYGSTTVVLSATYTVEWSIAIDLSAVGFPGWGISGAQRQTTYLWMPAVPCTAPTCGARRAAGSAKLPSCRSRARNAVHGKLACVTGDSAGVPVAGPSGVLASRSSQQKCIWPRCAGYINRLHNSHTRAW